MNIIHCFPWVVEFFLIYHSQGVWHNLKKLGEMYLERCHFITVINRTSFERFCIYQYFMGFDGVLEWKQNKALGSQATPRASLCIVHPREILLSESQTESCYKSGFLKGTSGKRSSRISILLLSIAVADCVSYPASALVTSFFLFFLRPSPLFLIPWACGREDSA